MSDDELTRAIVQAISSYWSGKGTERKPPVVHKNDMASDIAAALAPLIVQREQRAFDRGYDKAMEGAEARAREAEVVAWQEGYDAARGMARCYGHTDHWEGAPENPYRRAES